MSRAAALLLVALALPVAAAEAPAVLSPREQTKELVAKALVEEKMGNYPAALELYVQAHRISPEEPYIRQCLDRLTASIYARGQRTRERQRGRHVQEAVRGTEATGFRMNEADELCAEGDRLLSQGRDLQAVDAFYQVLAKKEGHSPALKGLQRAARRMDDRLRKGRFDSPQQFAAHQGMRHFVDKEWQPAIDAFDKAMKEGPLDEELTLARLPDYAAKARVNLDRETWKTARREVFAQALEKYKAKKWLEAEPLFQRLLKVDPGDMEARPYAEEVFAKAEEARKRAAEEARLKGLKESLAESRRSASRGDDLGAVEAAARALDLEPASAEAKNLLTAAQDRLRRQGAFAPEVSFQNAAETAYRRALRLYGNDEKEEALKAVKEALKADPRHAEAKALKARLTSKDDHP